MIKNVDLKKHMGKIRNLNKKYFKKLSPPPPLKYLNESMMTCLTTKKYISNVIMLTSVYDLKKKALIFCKFYSIRDHGHRLEKWKIGINIDLCLNLGTWTRFELKFIIFF